MHDLRAQSRSSLPDPSETLEARVTERSAGAVDSFVTEQFRSRAPQAGRSLLRRRSMTVAEAPKASRPSGWADRRHDLAVSFPSAGFAFSLISFVVEASRKICS